MNKFKKILIIIGLCLMALVFLFPSRIAYASSNLEFSSVSLSNGDFNSSPNSATLDTSPTGWSTIKKSSTAKSGVINVLDTKFNANYTSYLLGADENPEKMSSDYDNKVLMLNARTSIDGEIPAVQGFKSSSVAVSAHSYYSFSVLAKTINNAKASIYLTGLENATNVQFESFEADEWTEFVIYVATGTTGDNVNIELWLGKKDNVTSSGAVFFDNVTITKYTHSRFQSEIAHPNTSSYVSIVEELDKNYISNINSELAYADANLDFEKGTLAKWTIANNEFPEGAIADVFNVTQDFSLGSDRTANNNYALKLSTEIAGYFGYVSPKIEIPMHSIYKVSINAKTESINGNAYILLKENNDINEFYDKDNPSENHTVVESELKFNTNSENQLTNDYTTYTFYVLGNTLYNSSFNIELWLGQSDDLTKGTVVFDTIRIETVSHSFYSSASEGSTIAKADLNPASSTATFTNGNFNVLSNETETIEYPIKASSWTTSTTDEDASVAGVINTYSPLYESIKDSQLGGRTNPQNPNYLGVPTSTSDTNNILMMWNKGLSAQTITSSTFSASANTYYTLKFSYKTISDSLDEEVLNIYVLDNNNTVLFEKYGLYSTTWSDYSLTIRTSDNAQTLKIKIELGTEDKKVSGVAYFDNFEVNTTTLSNDAYTTLVQTSDVIDFTNAGFNLKASEIQNGMYRPLTYTSKLESGSNSQTGLPVAFGGLIDSENNDINLEANPKNTSLIKNVLMIKNTNASTYSFTSNNSITLTENTYYKFSVYILTKLPHNESEEIYGAEFSLDGIDAKIEGIINDDYVEYVIYVKTQSEATVKPRFALTADCLANTGSAFFDTFTYETISATDYDKAQLNAPLNATFAETDLVEDNEDPEDENDNNGGSVIWYVIPSLILAVALILALTGYIMKKVKVKKHTKLKRGTYDRTKTMYRDALRKEADDKRNEVVKALKADLKTLEDELLALETENKERIANSRKEHGKQITKEDEKAFKLYASKHTKALNKIDRIKSEIEYVSSDEYLLREIKKLQQNKR